MARDYAARADLQFVFMEDHEETAPGVFVTTYADGTKTFADYNRNTFRVDRSIRPKLAFLPPGAVKPAGWLGDRARAAADGYTGHMDEVDRGFADAWTDGFTPRGKMLDWWEAQQVGQLGALPAELGAYWWDGLVRLAWQLDDPKLQALVRTKLEPLLRNMSTNAINFCWWMNRHSEKDVAEISKYGYIVGAGGRLGRAVAAYYDVTGDKRALAAMDNALDDYRFWKLGNPVTMPSAAYDAFVRGGNPKLAENLVEFSRYENPDWGSMRYRDPPPENTIYLRQKLSDLPDHRLQHGVMFEESALSFLKLYLHTGERRFLENVLRWFAYLDKWAMMPYGTIVADENWGYAGAKRSTETCVVAADMWTRLNLLSITGEGRWGDDVERNFFNAGLAATDAKYSRHVYLQVPNRVATNVVYDATCFTYAGEWDYRRKHTPLCCTATLNRILPELVQMMWMKPLEGGLAATLYAPCTVETEVAGVKVKVEERTGYPFEGDEIRFVFTCERPVRFPLKLRVPAWCADCSLKAGADGFAVVEREWKTGDEYVLELPRKERTHYLADWNLAGKRYSYTLKGPLLLAEEPGKKGLVPYGLTEFRTSLFPAEVAPRTDLGRPEETVAVVEVPSASMGKKIPVTVILPWGEHLRNDPAKRFPVVYLLHGASDSHRHAMHPMFRRLAMEHKVMVVCPSGTRTWWLDSPVDPKYRYETFVTKELVPWIDAHYPTVPDRDHRGLTGNSMGGHGSFYLAMRHPDLFGAAAAIFGGHDLWAWRDSGRWELRERLGDPVAHPEYWKDNSVVNLARNLKPGELRLMMAVGDHDIFIEPNRMLHRLLLEKAVQHTYVEEIGGHCQEFWEKYYPVMFRFISQRVLK